MGVGGREKEVRVGLLKWFRGVGERLKGMGDSLEMGREFKGIKLRWCKFIEWVNEIKVVGGL